MLPQPDPYVLDSNPRFAALYKDLKEVRLERDGCSRVVDGGAVKEGQVLREALHAARVAEAQKGVLRDALKIVGHGGADVPEELRQTVQIISAQLEGRIADADREIVDGEIQYFLEELRHIAPAVSERISQNVELLAQISDPSSPPSDLPAHVRKLQMQLSDTRATLSTARTDIALQTSALLGQYTELYEILIRILEQVLHGSMARHTRAQANYLCTVAEGMAKKIAVLKAQVVSQVYDGRTRAALEDKMEEVEREERRMRVVLARREALLGELEVGGRPLEKVVEDVRGVKGEIEKVKAEVERLEGEV